MIQRNRLLITIIQGVSDIDAIAAVARVVAMGRVSDGTDGNKHYCWHSTLTNGVQVSTRQKKKHQTSDSFLVWR
jgi:hypothetical protein